jgi:uncharacterized membrane protein YqhA
MTFLTQIVARFRYLFLAAVFLLLVLSLGSMVIGVLQGAALVLDPPGMKPGAGSLFVSYFIRAAFLYFLAVAFCTLFIGDAPVPQWMLVRNLFQFKIKVLTFIAVIAALNFLRFLADGTRGPLEILYAGGGIFLVLAGIFLLTRQGAPSGDEVMSREGNRPYTAQGRERKREHDRRQVDRKRGEDKAWLEKQKDHLKFEKETLLKEGEEGKTGRPGERTSGNVTVKPGPKRPPRRRRPREE